VKRTPFYDKHVALGGKMVAFGGFEMPIQYPKGIIAEHKLVREGGGGVFDVSHMGEFDVKGPDALNYLQHLTTNDVSKLEPGKAQYSCLVKEDGGIIDDCIVYMLAPEHYMVVVNGATQEKDWAWFAHHKAHHNHNVEIRNDSDKIALLAVQGKNAMDALQKLTDVDLRSLKYYHFAQGKLAGEDMIISRTGYTGEPGIEIYFSSEPSVASKVWDAVFEAGAEYGIEAIGLGARDTLRLEMGYCLYGNDIDETTFPLEAGLGWITKMKKDPPCLGFAGIAEREAKGIDRKLTGIVIEEKGAIARHGHKIYDAADYHIGEVTSGNISPMLNKAIGLGYIAYKFTEPGTEVLIETRPGKKVKAVVQRPPFVTPEVKS
jgi:aminomethyltransferase